MVRRKKKTAADIFDATKENGARPVEETDINGDRVPTRIKDGTKENYDRMMELWDEYVYNSDIPLGGHLLSFPLMEQVQEKISWKEHSRFANTEALYGLLCKGLE